MEITNATKTLLFTQQQFFQNESFYRRTDGSPFRPS